MKQLLLAFLLAFGWNAHAIELSPNVEVTILTCSPGTDLYSVFGHSAIRVNDPGQFDWVYNYGTFDFSDDFYLQFAQGKLNYRLSKSDFPLFNYEYIVTERAVWEQVLNLNQEEKQKLFDLLEANNLPENRYYLYDFFFDNCATRVRDVLKEGLDDQIVFHSSFTPDSITFRQMIDRYLVNHDWSDFGIDIALGLPCDDKMQEEENMFLPDYIMDEFATATITSNGALKERKLVRETRELLPIIEKDITPPVDWTLVLTLSVALLALIHFYCARAGKTQKVGTPRFILIFLGLLGIGVFLLWFATDHVTTKPNMNILWAFPIHFFVAFILKKREGVLRFYFTAFTLLYAFLLLFGWLMPQQFHLSLYPLFFAGLLTMLRLSPLSWGKSH